MILLLNLVRPWPISATILSTTVALSVQARLGQQRLNAAVGMVEPLMTSLEMFAAACGSESEVMDASVQREDRVGREAPTQKHDGPCGVYCRA